MINNQIVDLVMFCALQKTYLLIVANLQSNNLFNFSTYSVANSHETWNL